MTAATIDPAQLTDPRFHAEGDIRGVWRWMRENAPVHLHPAGELPRFWSLTRYDDIRDAYRDPETFSSAHGVLLRPARLGADPGAGLTLALTDPPHHRQLRGLIAGNFSERSARSIEDQMRADVRSVLGRAVEQGECDFAHDVAARLSIYIVCRLMGIPEPDYGTLFRWTYEAFESGKPLTAHVALMQYFIDIMFDRINAAPSDIVGDLVHGDVDGRVLTEEEILLNCENIVGATENAGLSMANGLLAFLEHPQQWQRLRDDRALLPTAVEEILRWSSSATHSMRVATRATTIRGALIEAGDRVVLWVPSANRDPAAFDDPDRFDIARRPNRHLALGTGEHVCIGNTMARAQTRILLTELLTMVHSFELVDPAIPVHSIAVNGPAHMRVRFTPK